MLPSIVFEPPPLAFTATCENNGVKKHKPKRRTLKRTFHFCFIGHSPDKLLQFEFGQLKDALKLVYIDEYLSTHYILDIY
jgi:hypothetical protein